MNDFVLKWENGIINEAVVKKAADGKNYAILKSDFNDIDIVANLEKSLFEEAHLDSYPKTINGQHCLIVDGFSKMEDLQKILTAVGATSGQPNIDSIKGEKKDFGQWSEEFRHNSALKISGLLGAAGHVGLTAIGAIAESNRDKDGKIHAIKWNKGHDGKSHLLRLTNQEGEFELGTDLDTDLNLKFGGKIQLAAMFMVNCLLYAKYGNGDRGLQTNKILNETNDFLKANGIDVQTTELSDLFDKYQRDKPFMHKVDDFIADNLIQINESLGALCNIAMIKNGIINKDFGIFSAGIASFFGSMAAIFVEEKPISEQNPEDMKNPLYRIWAWIQESPMRFNGYTNLYNAGSFVTDTAKPLYAQACNGMLDGNPIDTIQVLMGNKTPKNIDEEYDIRQQAFNDAKLQYINGMQNNVDPKILESLEKSYAKTTTDLNEANSFKLFQTHGTTVGTLTGITSSLYMGATILSTISSKDVAKSSDPYEQYDKLFVKAAKQAMLKPEGTERDKEIYLMSAGLAANPKVKGLDADQINEYLHKEISDLQQNPFNSVGKNNIVKLNKQPESSIKTHNVILSDSKLSQLSEPELIKLK
jgi:hypothetical protein